MEDNKSMTPLRPHLFRAFYDWLVENDLTPYISVDAELPFVFVPEGYINDGMIVLNISPSSIGSFFMDNEKIGFNARFGGIPCQLDIPFYAIQVIYAKEGNWMLPFQPEAVYEAQLDEMIKTDKKPDSQQVAPKVTLLEGNNMKAKDNSITTKTKNPTTTKKPQLRLVDD